MWATCEALNATRACSTVAVAATVPPIIVTAAAVASISRARREPGSGRSHRRPFGLQGEMPSQVGDELRLGRPVAGALERGLAIAVRRTSASPVLGLNDAGRRSDSNASTKEAGLPGGHCCCSIMSAAIRRARCWSTLALPVLTPMARAASLIEQVSRNLSSRMRR